jgi:hypothetical protein
MAPVIPTAFKSYPTPGSDSLGKVSKPHPLRKPSPDKLANQAIRPVKATNNR